ncbi:MAG: hypothetical protein Q9204_003975 [Flavoplaca sp. TL-2023a]
MVSCPQHPQIPDQPCTCPPSPRPPTHIIIITAAAAFSVLIACIYLLQTLVNASPPSSKPGLIVFEMIFVIAIFCPSMMGIICWVYMQLAIAFPEEHHPTGTHGFGGDGRGAARKDEFEGPPDYEANAMLVPKNGFWERSCG